MSMFVVVSKSSDSNSNSGKAGFELDSLGSGYAGGSGFGWHVGVR